MTPALWVFFGLVLTSTVAVVVSVILAFHVLRRFDEAWPKRIAMALLVPWGAVESWRRGAHVLPAVWAVAVIAYVAFRIAAAAGSFA